MTPSTKSGGPCVALLARFLATRHSGSAAIPLPANPVLLSKIHPKSKIYHPKSKICPTRYQPPCPAGVAQRVGGLLSNDHFHINIKCLLHDDFLFKFFAGLAITPIQTSCRNHCATQPKTNESLHHSCGRLRDILLKSLQTRYPLFPITS